jgi:hypothetical protein
MFDMHIHIHLEMFVTLRRHIATFGNVCHIATSHCNIWKCLSHCDVTMFCRLQCYYVHNIMTLLCSPYFNTIFSSHCNVMCSSQCDFTMFGRFQCYYVQHIAKFGIFCHIMTLQQPHIKITTFVTLRLCNNHIIRF